MHPSLVNIERYRDLLQQDRPSLTRRSLEWLLVNSICEFAGIEAFQLPQDHWQPPELMVLAEDAVDKAIGLMGSQFGTLQLYIHSQDTLLMLAYRNFGPGFASAFGTFRPDGCTTCSRAVASGRRVVVEDIERDEPFARHVPAARAAGFRSLQSTPLKDRRGRTMGVMTTHFAEPRSFSNDELATFDAHAEHVAGELEKIWATA